MAQNTPLILSRARLVDFLDCPRRFELRYLRQLAWPTVPLDAETAVSLQNGQQFHNLLERHFLHLPTDSDNLPPTIANWFSIFQRNKAMLPAGDYLPELTLTVPIGDHFLTGRFDLLVREANGRLHLFDWKTGRPRSEAALRADWQTRLYLAMVVESGHAIGNAITSPVAAEKVSISYWYVDEPHAPRHIRYDAAWHKRNWAEIEAICQQLTLKNEQATADNEQSLWEKTTNLDNCRRCPYQIYCHRQNGEQSPIPDPDLQSLIPNPNMEPALP